MSLGITISGPTVPPKVLEKLVAALTPERIDPVVERVAVETFSNLVRNTPQKWFGQVRKAWQLTKPRVGERNVINKNKVMRFLEFGTKAHGPVQKKFLYIPLTRQAASGWSASLKRGVDYILVKRVRGIEPRGIVAAERAATGVRLLAAAKAHIKAAIA